MCVLGGYFGSIVCNLRAMAYAEQKEAREHIQVITKNHVEDYLSESSVQTGAVRETIFKEADVDAVAKKAAKIVTDKLINNAIEGVATDAEVEILEGRIKDMFSKYEIPEEQKKDLVKSVAAIIESDLDKLNKNPNAETALSAAADKNIRDLKTKVADLQARVDGIDKTLAELKAGTADIKSDIDTSLSGYATSGQASILQGNVDNLTRKYNDLLKKYNEQTSKIQQLVSQGTGCNAVDDIETQINTLQASLTTLKGSAEAEITALNNRISELGSASSDELISDLEGKIAEQQKQVASYKSAIQKLNTSLSSLKTQMSEIDEKDVVARSQLQTQIDDANKLIEKNWGNIDTANTNISDMKQEIDSLKNGTADNVESLQGQITKITASIKEMTTTENTLDTLLKELKGTVGDREAPASGTIAGDLASTRTALSLLEGRAESLETKTQNIKSGVQVPFSFGVKDGEYGYYDADNTFVDFKSQSDIEGAVADATGNMTGTAGKDRYVVTAQGTSNYKTGNIKNDFFISLNGSKDQDGNYVLKANGENVHTLYKQAQAIGREYRGIGGTLTSSILNGDTRLPMSDYKDTTGKYTFSLGFEEQINFPAGYYDAPINVVNGICPTGTFNATARAANIDMGASSFYRYVNTNNVPNNNSGTYTFPYGTGGTVDLGVTNSYRYVNAGNVFNAGKDYMFTTENTWLSISRSSCLAISPLITHKSYDYIYIKDSVTHDVPLNSNDVIRIWVKVGDAAWGNKVIEAPISSGRHLAGGWYQFGAAGGISIVELANYNNVPRDYLYHFSN